MPAAALNCTAELVEDYFPLSVDSGVGSALVAVVDDTPGHAEPSVVLVNGASVVWMRPDPLSESGFSADQSPAFEGPVTGLHAFVLSGVLVVVAAVSTSSGTRVHVRYRLADDSAVKFASGWCEAPYPNQASQLVADPVDFVTATSGGGHAYLALHTRKGAALFYLSALTYQNPAGTWLQPWQQVNNVPWTFQPPSGAKGNVTFGGPGSTGFDALHLVAGLNAASQPALFVAATGPGRFGWLQLPADLSNPKARYGSGTWTAVASLTAGARSCPLPGISTALSAEIGFLSSDGSVTAVRISSQGAVTVTSAPGPFTALTGSMVSSEGGYAYYGLGTSGLWTCMSGFQSGPNLDDWEQVDATALPALAAPYQTAELLLFTLGQDHSVSMLAGDPWASAPVGAPGPAMPPVPDAGTPLVLPQAGYLWEVSVVDDDGNPAPDTDVMLFSDRPMLAYVNGLTLPLDADLPATVASDVFGRVTVRSPADGVVAPVLKVFVADFMDAGTTSTQLADLGAHQRLSAITAADLTTNGLIDASLNAQAPSLAAALSGIGNQLVASAPGVRVKRDPGPPVYGQLLAGPQPQYVPLTSDQWSALPSNGQQVKRDWGSFVEWAKSAGQAVMKLAFSIGDQITVWADGVRQWTLRTAREIGAFAELVFTRIGQFAAAVGDRVRTWLRWLRKLFDWDDVARTQQVISSLVNGTLLNLEASLEYFQGAVHAQFDQAKQQVSSAIFELQQKLGGTTLGYPGAAPTTLAPWGSTPDLPALRDQAATDSARQNYLWGQLFAQADSVALTAPTPSSSVDGIQTAASALLQPQLDGVQGAMSNWGALNVQAGTAARNPTVNFTASLSAVLNALDAAITAIIGGVGALAEALVGALADAIEAFRQVVTSPIDIPIFTWLTKRRPTALDVFSWTLALPVTIVAKLLNDDQAPFNDADVATVTSQRPAWPPSMSSKSTEALAPTSADALSPSAATGFAAMVWAAGIAQFPLQVLMDAATARNRKNKIVKWEQRLKIGAGVAIVLDGLLCALTCPFWTIKPDLSAASTAALTLQWATTNIPLLVTDMLSLVASLAGGDAFAPLTKGWATAGPGVVAVSGLVALGVCIWAAVQTDGKPSGVDGVTPYGVWDWLPPILASVNQISKVTLFAIDAAVASAAEAGPAAQEAAQESAAKLVSLALALFDLCGAAAAAMSGTALMPGAPE